MALERNGAPGVFEFASSVPPSSNADLFLLNESHSGGDGMPVRHKRSFHRTLSSIEIYSVRIVSLILLLIALFKILKSAW